VVDVLAAADGLGTGTGVALADGEEVGTEIAGPHVTISSDASVASDATR
jgi:hypothetical protein